MNTETEIADAEVPPGGMISVDNPMLDKMRMCLCGCGTLVPGYFAKGHQGRFKNLMRKVEAGVLAVSALPTSIQGGFSFVKKGKGYVATTNYDGSPWGKRAGYTTSKRALKKDSNAVEEALAAVPIGVPGPTITLQAPHLTFTIKTENPIDLDRAWGIVSSVLLQHPSAGTSDITITLAPREAETH